MFARLQMSIDTEELMNEAISKAGGQIVASLLPPNLAYTPENADYGFPERNVILELKSLQKELFTPAYREKLRELAFAWRKQGLIHVFGTAVLELKKIAADLSTAMASLTYKIPPDPRCFESK